MQPCSIFLIGLCFLYMVTLESCSKTEKCSDNAVEVNGDCKCKEGYFGYNCEQVDECIVSDKQCENEGVCASAECHCFGFYSGEHCEYFPPNAIKGLYIVQSLELDSFSEHYADDHVWKIIVWDMVEHVERFGWFFDYSMPYSHIEDGGHLRGELEDQCANCGDTLVFRLQSSELASLLRNNVNFDFRVKFSNGVMIGEGVYYSIIDRLTNGRYPRQLETTARFKAVKE